MNMLQTIYQTINQVQYQCDKHEYDVRFAWKCVGASGTNYFTLCMVTTPPNHMSHIAIPQNGMFLLERAHETFRYLQYQHEEHEYDVRLAWK
jgi:hypothetical protein